MSEKGNGKLPRVGVYICHCGLNIASVVDVEEVAKFAATLPGVVLSKTYKYMCSDPGLELIKNDIKEHNLERVVVASCSPLLHEHTFRKAVEEAGLNPYLAVHVNIREQVSWVHAFDRKVATEKAKALVAAGVRRVIAQKPLERKRVDVHPDVLVVGGGIAGIHASLVLADSGKKVYLVEREPTIGGHMAKFDKTFPTLDCAACILTPKMAQVGSHPNIELYTYSEVKSVEGYVGNFTVKILKKSRHIIEDKCTGCGECAKVCPVEIPSAFEEGLGTRKATYRPFPQAVPNIYVIERLGAPPCEAACPIHQNAFGYVALVAAGKFKEAAEVILRDNPLPSVCGRVCTHPCMEACTRKDYGEAINIRALKRFVMDYVGDYKLPMPERPERKERVAIVGSGPAGLVAAYELRKRGYQVTIYEKLPVAGGMLKVGIPDFRLPSEILDKEIKRILDTGVELKLGVELGKDITLEQLKRDYDAVFLAIGAHKERKLGVEGEDLEGVWGGVDFLRKVNLGEKVDLTGKRVGVVGGGNSAIDAARTALRLGASEVTIFYRRTIKEMPADPEEVHAALEEGIKIEFLRNPVRFIGEGGRLKAVELIKMRLGEPDASGRRRPVPIEGSEYQVPVDAVIVTIGQEPEVPENIGLPLTRWKTFDVDPVTLQTKDPKVFAGGDCVNGPDVVITAMMHGKKAAESIHRFLNGLDMYEGRELEGPYQGVVRDFKYDKIENLPRLNPEELPPTDRARKWDEVAKAYTPERAMEEAKRCLACSICCDCHLCQPVCPAECIDYDIKDQEVEVKVGAIVVATGFKTFDARRIKEYGYGRYPNVFTALEVERLVNSAGPTEGKLVTRDGKTPKSVAIIHCVGSRDKNYNEWCSRVCCMYSLKLAHLIHERTGAEVYNLYIDMRTPGKGYEEFYKKLLDEGVHFIRGRVAEVTDWAVHPSEEGKLVVRVEDTLAGHVRRIPVDMVVLSVGLEPQPDAEEIRRMLNLSCSHEGWFLERHPKLAPVSTMTGGIYIAGCCQGPKDIPDTVAQAGAAAGEVLALVDKGYIEIEPIKAHINEELCSGCKICIGLCPYSAISFDQEKKVSVINDVLCEGCGTCVAACPSGAIEQDLFTTEELLLELEGVTRYV